MHEEEKTSWASGFVPSTSWSSVDFRCTRLSEVYDTDATVRMPEDHYLFLEKFRVRGKKEEMIAMNQLKKKSRYFKVDPLDEPHPKSGQYRPNLDENGRSRNEPFPLNFPITSYQTRCFDTEVQTQLKGSILDQSPLCSLLNARRDYDSIFYLKDQANSARKP